MRNLGPAAPVQGGNQPMSLFKSEVFVAWDDEETQQQCHLGGLSHQKGGNNSDPANLTLYIGNNLSDNTMLINLHVPIMDSVKTTHDVYIILPAEHLQMRTATIHRTDLEVPNALRQRRHDSMSPVDNDYDNDGALDYFTRIRFTLTMSAVTLLPVLAHGHSLSFDHNQQHILTSLRSLAQAKELIVFLPRGDGVDSIILREVGLALSQGGPRTPKPALKPVSADGRAWSVDTWKKFLERVDSSTGKTSTSTKPYTQNPSNAWASPTVGGNRLPNSCSTFEPSPGGATQVPQSGGLFGSLGSTNAGSTYNSPASTAYGSTTGNSFLGGSNAANASYNMYGSGGYTHSSGGLFASITPSSAYQQPNRPYMQSMLRSDQVEGLAVGQDPMNFLGISLVKMQKDLNKEMQKAKEEEKIRKAMEEKKKRKSMEEKMRKTMVDCTARFSARKHTAAFRAMQTQIPNPFTPTGTDFNFTSKAPTPKKRQSMPRTSPASATGSDFDFDFTFRAPTSNPSQNYYDNRPISWSASARFPTAAPVAAPAAVPAAVPAASVPRRKTRQSYPRAIPVALEIPEPPQPGKKKQQKPRLKQEELHEYDEAALAAHNKSTMKPSSRIHEKAVMPTFIWAPPLISVPWLSPGHGVSWRRTVRRVGVRRVRVMSWIRGR